MKYFLTILGLTVGVAIGAIAIVHGEGDDSPGLQGLGGLIVLGMIVLGVRAVRRRGRRATRATLITDEHAKDTSQND